MTWKLWGLPRGVKLHKKKLLGHGKVSEGISGEDMHSFVLYDVVVAFWLLQRIQCVLQVAVILPEWIVNVCVDDGDLLEAWAAWTIVRSSLCKAEDTDQRQEPAHHPATLTLW